MDGKKLILLRLMRRHKHRLFPGKRVCMKGTKKRGAVVELHEDALSVDWANGQPLFVEVKLDDETVIKIHPKALKTKSR